MYFLLGCYEGIATLVQNDDNNIGHPHVREKDERQKGGTFGG
jgi:hypothetical protein